VTRPTSARQQPEPPRRRGPAEVGAAVHAVAVTRDPALADLLGRLAAAAGVPLRMTSEPSAAPRSAALVLIGADLAADVPAGALPPGARPWRPGVVVVAPEPVGEPVWRLAMHHQAETVAVLPEAEKWLVERLLEAAEPAAEAPVIGVIGGRGGAGASVLATALALTAADAGLRPLLIDADPLGGGLDMLLGAEHEPGLRWPGLSTARGWLQPALLRSELVQVDGIDLVSWDRSDLPEVPVEAMSAVLAGAMRGAGLVVVDLPRSLDAAAVVAVQACGRVLLVVPAEARATAAARRVVQSLEPHVGDLGVVVRGPVPAGVMAESVAETLELPLVGELRAEKGLAAALDRGEPPWIRPRGPLATVSRRLLADALAVPGGAGAPGAPARELRSRAQARHRAPRGASGAA
jgi:secretion/DNA translocation related CpaE-like protein